MIFRAFVFFFVLVISVPAYADPVMDRINKTQTIRCGYVSSPQSNFRDPNTGEMHGYNVEIIEEAARRMDLKIDWTYETNWPVIAADLEADKFDLFCVGFWSNPRSAKAMISTNPLFYQPVFFATRVGDARFDNDISLVNAPGVKVAVLEGDVPETILREVYPEAVLSKLSPDAGFAQLFQDVASKKADVTITSRPNMADFEKNSPNTLKLVTSHPVRIYSCAMQMLPAATHLQSALNTTFREMQMDGTIRKIMQKYAVSEDDFYFVDWPYSKPSVK